MLLSMGILAWKGGAVVWVISDVGIFGAYHFRIFGVPRCAKDVRVWCLEHTIPDRWPSSHPFVQLGWCDGDGFSFGMSMSLSSSIFSHPLASRRTLTISKNAGCIAFGWAESHGDISYTIFLIVINVGCLRLSSSHQYTQMIRCIQCHIWWMKLMKLKFCPCSGKASFRCCAVWPWEGAAEGCWGLLRALMKCWNIMQHARCNIAQHTCKKYQKIK